MLKPEDCGNLTIGKLMKVYDSLPSVPPMRILMPIQSRMNEALNTAIETARMSVYYSEYLPWPDVRPLPRRRDYRTRAGFKKARNYRRWWNRDQERRVKRMAYLIGDKFKARMDQEVTEFFVGGYVER
jgi:hypothetical protein